MIKRSFPSILFLMHFLFLQGIHCQIPINMTDYLSERFLNYCKSVPREEIYIHSDREEYISGEELWFNVYLIDRQTFKPSLNSRIVYIELLNAENRPLIQKRILIDKGFGPGQILLPDTLSTGIYTIRAYTSWMKNFLPYNCFVKDITIYNALSDKTYKGKSNIGKYIAEGDSNKIIKEIKNTGVTLSVNNTKPDSLEIFVKSDNKFRSANNDIFYIFIQTHGNINHVSAEKMTEETTKIEIPKTLLSKGINQITIFNAKGKPVSERLIYTPDKENNILTLHSADSFNLKNKITLEIELQSEKSKKLNSTNISISVAPRTNDSKIMDVDDYMIFGTEYGLIPWNTEGKKINELPPEVIDSILLNVRSNWINWAKILSGDKPHLKYQIENEDHFLLGKLFTNDQQTADSTEYLLMCSPGKEAGFQYTKTDNEGNFSFKIHIDEELKDLIIMPDDVNKNHKIIVESSFSDQYLHPEISNDSTRVQIPSYISKWSVNYQVSKIYGFTSLGNPLDAVFQALKPIRFYGKPDIELIMKNYISLPSMEEVFFELLPNVSLKKKKSIYEISIVDRVDNTMNFTSPCLMIDGVIIKDASLIADVDPEIVEKIDVIEEKYLVGKYLFPSIVNVITKSSDFSCVSIPDYMIRLPYRVIDPVRSFISPDYSSAELKNSRIPDYRNTLYWNPAVKPDKNGKAKIEFWSSDNKSVYVINIQGITEEGNAFSLKKIIRVK